LLASLVASDTSIEDALEPVKLFEGIGERDCDIGSRLLSKPSTWISCAPLAAFRSERFVHDHVSQDRNLWRLKTR
jgi:hypothetical protein